MRYRPPDIPLVFPGVLGRADPAGMVPPFVLQTDEGHDVGVAQTVLAKGLPGDLAFALDVLVPVLLRQAPECVLAARKGLQRVVGIRLMVPDRLPG